MSTTVIVSAYTDADLFLRPWSEPAIDLDAVRGVLEDHGLEVLDVEPLTRGLEGVAAVGLPPGAANALARDLRQVGLTARVVNDPSITANARLSTAAASLVLVALVTWPLVIPAVVAVINALYILTRGSGLRAVAAVARTGEAAQERPERQALARIRELGEHLPPEILKPLLERAEGLARSAAREPEGAAARALAEILADLRRDHDEHIVVEARKLKADLARARRAVREVR